MAKRREFSRDTAAEIMRRVQRATGSQCEICGLIVAKGEIHHVKQDAMETDKRRRLTAKDGVFVCIPCHKAESAKQAPVLAKAKRNEAAALRIKTAPAAPIMSAPMPTTPRAAARRERAETTDKTRLLTGGRWIFGQYFEDKGHA